MYCLKNTLSDLNNDARDHPNHGQDLSQVTITSDGQLDVADNCYARLRALTCGNCCRSTDAGRPTSPEVAQCSATSLQAPDNHLGFKVLLYLAQV